VSAAAEDRRAAQEQADLIGDIIAEVARDHGVAISRDDPVVAVVLLNQVVLRRYLEETVAPAAAAIREATDAAVTHIEQLAEAQATWLEQVSLKDRASFLEAQKALHDAWKADMEALIEGQNTALQRVVERTATQLRLARTQGTVLAASETSALATSSPGRQRDQRSPKGLCLVAIAGVAGTVGFLLAYVSLAAASVVSF
jgi:AcrR family transcriptional regulator